MSFRAIAIYPGRLAALACRPGVRFRRRKRRDYTVMLARIETIDGRSVAVPEHAVPEETPPPRFKGQFEVARAAVEQRQSVHVILAAERDASKLDPEQVVLSPIFNDGRRIVFEFQRAYIMTVERTGQLETRYVAVHPVSGLVGTRTIHRFNTRWLGIANRSVEHLVGVLDLFPLLEPRLLRWQRIDVPRGEAALEFSPRRTSRPRQETTDTPQGEAGEVASSA
jgi:hypothetical protein